MGRFEVYRGVKDIMQLGEVVKFNDEKEVDAWDGECNKIIGTDSTMYTENKIPLMRNFEFIVTIFSRSFAPFHAKTDILYAFAPDLCRSLGAQYHRPSSYNGVPTGFYSIDFGDIKVHDELDSFLSPVVCGQF